MSSGHEINIDQFDAYCLVTANKYVSLYNWYYMPTTVHKILIHGSQVIENVVIPIGQLTEEAQEAKNKEMRRYREHHSRKCSRLKTNEDVFKRLLLSSDPILSTIGYKYKIKKEKCDIYYTEMLQLIKISNN